jgi:hypothetical protein
MSIGLYRDTYPTPALSYIVTAGQPVLISMTTQADLQRSAVRANWASSPATVHGR